MTFSATIIADSIGTDAPRLTTIELVYPRFIHSELMTHRAFSRNASSSRAIPVAKMLADLKANIAKPADWRMNEKGMQGYTVAPEGVVAQADALWNVAMMQAIDIAERMNAIGLHKQHVNRLLEPFAHIRVVVSSTQWKNWFGLRNHPDAEPSIAYLAALMQEAMDASTPTKLNNGEWHLPYVDDEASAICTEFAQSASVIDLDKLHIRSDDRNLTALEIKKRVSAARCARTSYKSLTTGRASTVNEDFDLFSRTLITGDIIHASPTEHQATPDFWLTKNKRWMSPLMHGNFNGWMQFRKSLPNENLDTVVGAEF